MKFFFAVFFVVVANIIPAHATFVPEDQIVLRSFKDQAGNLSEEQFRDILSAVQTAYEGIVKTHGGTLTIDGKWNGNQLNARATQTGERWRVEVTGALARLPELTADGLTLIVCHELGHHLGGFPYGERKMGDEKVWSANEGQADYFSAHVCARKMWGQDGKLNAGFRAQVSDFVKARCNAAWATAEQQDICYRTAVATQSVMRAMAVVTGMREPNFETPDTSTVGTTFNAHPEPQCRMDTIFQASICVVPFDEKIIPGKSPSGGSNSLEAEKESGLRTCTNLSRQSAGLRPACWFKNRL
jgi:hypothetical protein